MMLRSALRVTCRAIVIAQKQQVARSSVRMASHRTAPDALMPLDAGASLEPNSIRDLQSHLPAIRKREAPKTEIRIKQTALAGNGLMQVAWYDGQGSEFPYVWLRDNCQCESCYSQHDKKRMLTVDRLNVDVAPKKAKNLQDGTLLHVTWEDDHESFYTAKWLQEHCFERGMLALARENYCPKPQLWNTKLCESMKQHTLFDYDEIVSTADDSKLLTWLAILQSVGFTRISGAPVDGAAALENIIDRVSPMRALKHHNRGPISLFQTYDAGFQTGLPFYQHVPGIQLLHCEESSKEETLFVDGFAVAEMIRKKTPDVFEWLTKYDVAFKDEAGGEVEKRFKFLNRRLAPTLELNQVGEVFRVNYNNECRDSSVCRDGALNPSRLGTDEVQDLYACLKEYNNEMYNAFGNHSERHGFGYLLKPGDIVCTNNWRVLQLHGNGSVVTQGYFDWDEAQSKINVLSGQHRNLLFINETEQRN